MSKNENRLNFRMTDETAAKIERWYQEDNCRSKNEFIEKAVNCYADMLAAGQSASLAVVLVLAAVVGILFILVKKRKIKEGGDSHGKISKKHS